MIMLKGYSQNKATETKSKEVMLMNQIGPSVSELYVADADLYAFWIAAVSIPAYRSSSGVMSQDTLL